MTLNEQYVRFYCLNVTLLPVVYAVGDLKRLLISPSCAVQIIHYNGNDGSACVGFCSLDLSNGCCVVTKRTACTFVLLRVRFNWAVLLVINAVSGRSPKLIHTHYDADALIFI